MSELPRSELLLRTENLSKSFWLGGKEIKVLKGIGLQISKGAMVSLSGASGAGKSTLLHLIGTLDSPTAGDVFFEGGSLFKKSERELARFRNQKIGFVFQFHHLLPEFSAVENVMMPALILGISGLKKGEIVERAKEKLSEMGLGHRLSHKPGELSGGEQSRVAIARALMNQPPLLLADEPTGNLDRATGEQVIDLLFKLNEKYKMTMLIATHNEGLSARLPVRLKLVDGNLVQA